MIVKISRIIILLTALGFWACNNDDESGNTKSEEVKKDDKSMFSFKVNETDSNIHTAIEYGFDIWESYLEVKAPIEVNITFVPTISGASAVGIYNAKKGFDSAPNPNIWYPSALANTLEEKKISTDEVDIELLFDKSVDWYYGLDGKPGTDQLDFVTLFLHELCHGLGFASVGCIHESEGKFTEISENIKQSITFPLVDLEKKTFSFEQFFRDS